MIDRRLAMLLIAALGLAGYSLWSGDGALMSFMNPAQAPANAPSAPKASTAEATQPIAVAELNPLSGMTAEQFEEILKRPLFNPSRAPAPPPPEPQPEPEQVVTEEPPPQEAPPNPEDFTLLGIAAKDEAWTAVLRWNPTNEVFRLQTGGEMQGWTVAAIAPQGVTVTKGEQSLDIKMFLQRSAPPPMTDEGGEVEEGMAPPADEGQLDQSGTPQEAIMAQQAEERRRAQEERRAMEAQQQLPQQE
jgi:hypothetical protein